LFSKFLDRFYSISQVPETKSIGVIFFNMESISFYIRRHSRGTQTENQLGQSGHTYNQTQVSCMDTPLDTPPPPIWSADPILDNTPAHSSVDSGFCEPFMLNYNDNAANDLAQFNQLIDWGIFPTCDTDNNDMALFNEIDDWSKELDAIFGIQQYTNANTEIQGCPVPQLDAILDLEAQHAGAGADNEMQECSFLSSMFDDEDENKNPLRGFTEWDALRIRAKMDDSTYTQQGQEEKGLGPLESNPGACPRNEEGQVELIELQPVQHLQHDEITCTCNVKELTTNIQLAFDILGKVYEFHPWLFKDVDLGKWFEHAGQNGDNDKAQPSTQDVYFSDTSAYYTDSEMEFP
jgi:hypothetical protein